MPVQIGSDGDLGIKLGVCPCCMKDNNEVLIMGTAQNKLVFPDGSPAKHARRVLSGLCSECEHILENGGVWIRRANADGSIPQDADGIRLKAEVAQHFIAEEVYNAAREHGGLLRCTSQDFDEIAQMLQGLVDEQEKE